MNHNVPNLDCLSDTDLSHFSNAYLYGRNFTSLFPEALTVADKRAAQRHTATLSNYAATILAARKARLEGFIEGAGEYEAAAERQYRRLPKAIRW